MMTSDARDMMGLPSAGPSKPAPTKTPKPKIRGPIGVSREVLDLNYEGAPPISIVAPKFKEKPKLPFKPRAWEDTQFRNSARQDGLIFRHWRRKGDIANGGVALPVTPADSNAASEMDQEDKSANHIPDSYFAKYNVSIPRPQYSNEEYEKHMSSDSWSKEETDYLVELAIDYDLRWVVISDRYDFQLKEMPKENDESMAVTLQPTPRSQEEMKSRYYTIAAKAMSLRIPVEKMSSSEFETHEKMLKYNPVQETNRKRYAEQLMARTEDEKHEEELLLKELSRIVLNQEKLFNERKALYDRLDAPRTAPSDHSTTTMYQTSSGLTHLMQNMVAQTKNKELEKKQKRQSAMGQDEVNQNPADRPRQSIDNVTNKRSSLGSSAQSHHRHLSPRDQQRFGVSSPTNERLVGGVTFRNERATKAAQAKSSIQTTRISQALTELNIPPRLMMPTSRVVAEYEKLIEGVKVLLETRKVSEKVEGEIKVWRAQREQAETRERGEDVMQRRPTEEDRPTPKQQALPVDGSKENDSEEGRDEPGEEDKVVEAQDVKREGDSDAEKARVQNDHVEGEDPDEDTRMEDEPQHGDDDEHNDEREENEDEEDEAATAHAAVEDEEDEEEDDTRNDVAVEDDDEEDEEEEEEEEEEEDADVDADAEVDIRAEDADEDEDEDEDKDEDADAVVHGGDDHEDEMEVEDGEEDEDAQDERVENEEDEDQEDQEDEQADENEVEEEQDAEGEDDVVDADGELEAGLDNVVNGGESHQVEWGEDADGEEEGREELEGGQDASVSASNTGAKSMRKRSASVISAVSNKSTKRQRK